MSAMKLHNAQGGVTCVSNVFIEEYLPAANATFVKVYLYALHCCETARAVTNGEIARILGILESDVINAWKYWQEAGAVSLLGQGDGIEVVFLPLTGIQAKSREPEKVGISGVPPLTDGDSMPDGMSMTPGAAEPAPPADRQPRQAAGAQEKGKKRPAYSPAQINDTLQRNPELKELYTYAEQKMGNILSNSEIRTLYSLYDWLKLPVEVIVMLFEYCDSLGKLNLRYIERVAISWADQGILSVEAAEDFFQKKEQQKQRAAQFMQMSGQDRALTEREQQYLDGWAGKFDFSVIQVAYEQMILNIGKISFPYMDTVLANWEKKGVATAADAAKEVEEYRSGKQQPKKTRFNNFEQNDYDISQLEQAALEKRMNGGS